VSIAGFGILAVGLVCIFLPAPSVIVIPLGLAILATEFRWARRLLRPLGKLLAWLKSRVLRLLGRPPGPVDPKV
jgi:tellurite resistance protein TerC